MRNENLTTRLDKYDRAAEAPTRVTVLPEAYAAGQALTPESLATFIQGTPNLGSNMMPVLLPFANAGLTELQLRAILSIPYDEVKPRGKNEKTFHFAEAIVRVYGEDYLATLPKNYSRFMNFIETLSDAEILRGEIASNADATVTYALCFDLANELGVERTSLLLERLVDEAPKGASRFSRSVSALYKIKDLLDESRKMGYTPETLLDFRRCETITEDAEVEDY